MEDNKLTCNDYDLINESLDCLLENKYNGSFIVGLMDNLFDSIIPEEESKDPKYLQKKLNRSMKKEKDRIDREQSKKILADNITLLKAKIIYLKRGEEVETFISEI